jgi:hypothetical protein
MRLQAKTWAHFPMHIHQNEKEKISQKGVLCATEDEKEVKVHGNVNSVVLLYI